MQLMKYKTRDFGEREIGEADIVEFVQPPFGFEEYRSFAFLFDEAVGDQIAWLQSLEEPEVCFLLFDPSALSSFFIPQLPAEIELQLGAGELVCWVVGVVPENFKETTVNLKSPIIVNRKTRRGAQVILEQDYPIRYRLMGEAPSC